MNQGQPLPPSAKADRFLVRMPDGMRESLKQSAAQSLRTMNAEILFLIGRGIEVTYDNKNAAH